MKLKSGQIHTVASAFEKCLLVTHAAPTPTTVVHADGNECIRLYWEEGSVFLVLTYTHRPESPLTLTSPAKMGDEVVVSFTRPKVSLYIEGVLSDEEFPIGDLCQAGDMLTVGQTLHWEEGYSYSSGMEVSVQRNALLRPEGWRVPGHQAGVGDCMPVALGDKLHLFYLVDRHYHGSKWGLGAHQWGHMISADGEHFDLYPIAIPLDDQREGSICTGSAILYEQRIYAFYAVRPIDGSAATIRCAYSDDGQRFVKTQLSVTLKRPFDPRPARDPEVFLVNGQYHMLVTTALEDGRGCLAHLVSPDLYFWTQLEEPFLVMDDGRQPECPSYFALGDRYYVVYSVDGVGRYLVSDHPLAHFRAPCENNIVGDAGLRVPKITVFGGKAIAVGFRTHGAPYAGTVHFMQVLPEGDRLCFSPLWK